MIEFILMMLMLIYGVRLLLRAPRAIAQAVSTVRARIRLPRRDPVLLSTVTDYGRRLARREHGR